MISALFALSLLAQVPPPPPVRVPDPPKLELKDGDRIVYLGNTFAERDANYGYLETLLTIQHPDISFTFRNLGWSGDTVWGDARARFGTRADGFKHLKEHVLALKPTVILVAYGMNESFAGEAGLKEFEAGLNTLLDTLAETKAKIVLISPIPHENLGPPLPDPAKHNADLKLYRDVMATVAGSRKLLFVDLIGHIDSFNDFRKRLIARGRPMPPPILYTDDGLHPTRLGYSDLASTICITLGMRMGKDRFNRVLLEFTTDGVIKGPKVTASEKMGGRVQIDIMNDVLPPVVWLPDVEGYRGCIFIIRGAQPGKYVIRENGSEVGRFEMTPANKNSVTTAILRKGSEIDQYEKLRAVINAKNELYFHRWRPQNETYLFGFRKHEQGNNSVEIPQFDPLVAEKETEIARLKKPVKHTYEIIREEAGK